MSRRLISGAVAAWRPSFASTALSKAFDLRRCRPVLYGSIGRQFNRAIIKCVTGLLLLLPILAFSEAVRAQETRIVALGDSLMAGYGVNPEQALPSVLERKLREAGRKIRIQNASVSGDTTAGGLARLDWAMAEKPDFALVALGANDMLRGLDPGLMQGNLDKILVELKARGIKPILFGMRAQRNLGADYVKEFEQVFADLARRHDVPLYPFLLEGVAMQSALNLSDGLHPNARGIEVMAEQIAPFLQRALGGG